MAARDKFGEVIDVSHWLADDGYEEESSDNIAALFGESVFHTGDNVEEDGFVEEEKYVDFGDDSPQDIEEALKDRIAEAAKNGLSENGE